MGTHAARLADVSATPIALVTGALKPLAVARAILTFMSSLPWRAYRQTMIASSPGGHDEREQHGGDRGKRLQMRFLPAEKRDRANRIVHAQQKTRHSAGFPDSRLRGNDSSSRVAAQPLGELDQRPN